MSSLVDAARMHGLRCNCSFKIHRETSACHAQVYQRRIVAAGGVETLLTAMHRFVEFSMVQLSVVLCLIPLALGAHAYRRSRAAPLHGKAWARAAPQTCPRPVSRRRSLPAGLVPHVRLLRDCPRRRAGNPAMQARLARDALEGVLRAMRLHADSPDVAAKALVLVGVLAQVRHQERDACQDSEQAGQLDA